MNAIARPDRVSASRRAQVRPVYFDLFIRFKVLRKAREANNNPVQGAVQSEFSPPTAHWWHGHVRGRSGSGSCIVCEWVMPARVDAVSGRSALRCLSAMPNSRV